MRQKKPIGYAALVKAIDSVGLIELSRRLGVSYQLIQGWMLPNREYAAPAQYCPDIEAAVEGVVRCEELRPDVNWAVLRRVPV